MGSFHTQALSAHKSGGLHRPAVPSASPISAWVDTSAWVWLCQRVVGKEVEVWTTFIQGTFAVRVQAVVSGMFRESADNTLAEMSRVLVRMEACSAVRHGFGGVS